METSQVPKGTSQVPMGTSQVSMETSQVSMETSQVPMETSWEGSKLSEAPTPLGPERAETWARPWARPGPAHPSNLVKHQRIWDPELRR